MSEPFDLDALEADADNTPFVWRFGGEMFEFPYDPDYRAVELLERGKILDAFRLLMGDDEADRFDALPDTFGASKVEALLEAYGAHLGVDPKAVASRPSRRSSVHTGRTSKQTSKSTTK